MHNILIPVILLYAVIKEPKGEEAAFVCGIHSQHNTQAPVSHGCLCCDVSWHQGKQTQSAQGRTAQWIYLVLVDVTQDFDICWL